MGNEKHFNLMKYTREKNNANAREVKNKNLKKIFQEAKLAITTITSARNMSVMYQINFENILKLYML